MNWGDKLYVSEDLLDKTVKSKKHNVCFNLICDVANEC